MDIFLLHFRIPKVSYKILKGVAPNMIHEKTHNVGYCQIPKVKSWPLVVS